MENQNLSSQLPTSSALNPSSHLPNSPVPVQAILVYDEGITRYYRIYEGGVVRYIGRRNRPRNENSLILQGEGTTNNQPSVPNNALHGINRHSSFSQVLYMQYLAETSASTSAGVPNGQFLTSPRPWAQPLQSNEILSSHMVQNPRPQGQFTQHFMQLPMYQPPRYSNMRLLGAYSPHQSHLAVAGMPPNGYDNQNGYRPMLPHYVVPSGPITGQAINELSQSSNSHETTCVPMLTSSQALNSSRALNPSSVPMRLGQGMGMQNQHAAPVYANRATTQYGNPLTREASSLRGRQVPVEASGNMWNQAASMAITSGPSISITPHQSQSVNLQNRSRGREELPFGDDRLKRFEVGESSIAKRPKLEPITEDVDTKPTPQQLNQIPHTQVVQNQNNNATSFETMGLPVNPHHGLFNELQDAKESSVQVKQERNSP